MERGCHSDRCRGRDFHIVRKRRRLGRKTKAQMKRNRAFYSKWSRWRPCSQLCLTTRTKTCRYPAVCGAVQVSSTQPWKYLRYCCLRSELKLIFVSKSGEMSEKLSMRIFILTICQVTEEAYCYTAGSQCEAWYKAGRSLEVGAANGLQPAAQTPSKDDISRAPEHKHARSGGQQTQRVRDLRPECGRREIHGRSPSPGHAADIAYALRIIGGTEAGPGRWSWMVVILNKYRSIICFKVLPNVL